MQCSAMKTTTIVFGNIASDVTLPSFRLMAVVVFVYTNVFEYLSRVIYLFEPLSELADES